MKLEHLTENENKGEHALEFSDYLMDLEDAGFKEPLVAKLKKLGVNLLNHGYRFERKNNIVYFINDYVKVGFPSKDWVQNFTGDMEFRTASLVLGDIFGRPNVDKAINYDLDEIDKLAKARLEAIKNVNSYFK